MSDTTPQPANRHDDPKPMPGLLDRYHRLSLRSRLTLLFLTITLGSVLVVGLFGYSNASSAYRSKAMELVGGYTSETANRIDELQNLVVSDLGYLANAKALLRYLYWRDVRDEDKQVYWRALAGDLFREFATHYTYDYKIRFIDNDGVERIGVKRDPASGEVRITQGSDAHRLNDEDYFQRAQSLGVDGIYASSITLAKEMGHIEQPQVPVIHFVTPVIGDNDVRYGQIVVTVLADAYYRYVREANAISTTRHFQLIDGDGSYLFNEHPTRDEAGERVSGVDFNDEFPGLLPTVNAHEHLYTLESHGKIVSFRHIHPNRDRHENGFILVGSVDGEVAFAELHDFVLSFFVVLGVVLSLVLLTTRYFVNTLMRPLEAVNTQLQHLGTGEVSNDSALSSLNYLANDEIGRMVATSRKLMVNMERLALQADAVSHGDFSREVPLLSKQDRLGMAINNMTRMLRDARNEDQASNWLKEGINQLSKALTGDLSAQELADAAIGLAGRTLAVGRAVFYVYRAQEASLELLGTYMFSEREALGNRFQLGQGAIGQVARERKPIILHGDDAAPALITGTTRQAPHHTYTWPLVREGELLGVIEFATLQPLNPVQQEFIERAAEVMASFLYIVDQRDQIKELLQRAEQSAQEAQERSHHLQLANTQMEEQQQQLQQQAAELQAANSQMEEQQQQLQQQAAELQAANGQMEEQQNALEQRNRDLLRSQQALDERAKQLELASKYKSEFLANMSHELRTPLNSIILLAKMMASNEEHRLGEEEVKRAEVIHHSGQDLLRLINDVLDLSKVEAGRMELHSTPTATAALVEEFRDLFGMAASDKGLTLEVADEIQGEILVDRDKLSQIVRNLLSNALKFTHQGRVTLRLRRDPGEALPLRVSVSDTGIGVPEDKQGLIFEAFQQVDGSTNREYGGTGLGLSISASFAQLMGGTIEVQSRLGQGSTFTLSLPETPPEQTQTTPPPAARRSVPTAASRPLPTASHPTEPWPHDDRDSVGADDPVLLLIDDDPVIARAIYEINQRLGYKTLLAANGQSGLEMARQFGPNGILLDLGLPDMDGGAVLHTLKTTPNLAAIPVYIISGRDRDEFLLSQGALGWLRKPVDADQIARIEAEVLAYAGKKGSHDFLLVSAGEAQESEIRTMLGSADTRPIPLCVEAFDATRFAELREASGGFLFAIIDLGADASAFAQGLVVAQQIHQLDTELNLMFYSQRALSDEEEARLRQFSDVIIIKAPLSERRLQENIARFLKATPRQRHSGHIETPPTLGSGRKRLAERHILVVDDDPRNIFVITAALEQHGARVENALNGAKALEHLAVGHFDLVVMDIMMPEMDGYKTIEMMRADPRMADTPVLALSAKALSSDRAKAMEAGADDYLAKPADYEVLINLAAAWCEGRR